MKALTLSNNNEISKQNEVKKGLIFQKKDRKN